MIISRETDSQDTGYVYASQYTDSYGLTERRDATASVLTEVRLTEHVTCSVVHGQDIALLVFSALGR